MCRVIFCVGGSGCLLWLVCFLGKILLPFALLRCVLQSQTCILFWVCLDFLFPISWFPIPVPYDPMMKKTSFFLFSYFGVSSRSCRFSENHSTSASLALVVGAYLDYCDIEWFALEMNRDHSVIFEMHPSTAFQTLVDCMRATPFILCCVKAFKFD